MRYRTVGSREPAARPARRSPRPPHGPRPAAGARRVQLALGQRPVVVAGPVHQADLDPAVAAGPPHHTTGRPDPAGSSTVGHPRPRIRRTGARRLAGRSPGQLAGDDPAQQQLLEVVQRAARRAGTPGPGAVGRPARTRRSRRSSPASAPGRSSARRGRVGDPHQRLDPAVEVAVHQVGRADPDTRRVAAVAEPEDPRVLQEPAERSSGPGCSPTAPARPGAARRCRGRSGRPCTPAWRGPVERVDDPLVDQRVHLEPDQARPAGRTCAISRSIRSTMPAADAVRGDQQPPVRGLPAVAGEHVEQVGQVGADLRVGGEQAEVLVDAGRSSGGSCRCRCGSSGGSGCPPGAPPARSCSGSSARPGRRRRGSRPAPASGPRRCWPARRTGP